MRDSANTRREARTVADVGERGVIDLVARRLPKAPPGEVWSGDDAAVIAGAERLVMTTDLLVDGVDFDLRYCSGSDVGFKVVAVNVSDCAAMGAAPHRGVATLALARDTPVSIVESLADGMSEAAARWDVGLVGGDVSQAQELQVAVALTGVLFGQPVLRRGARPGDAVCVTGHLGGAAGGFVVLRRGLVGGAAPASITADLEAALTRLAARQLRPVARVEEARSIVARAPSSLIDVSDGLAVDLHNILAASGRGARVDPSAIPIDPDLVAVGGALADLDPWRVAVTGGEDFELLFTIDEARLDALAADGVAFTRIGTVTEDGAYIGEVSLEEYAEQSWEHLRGR